MQSLRKILLAVSAVLGAVVVLSLLLIAFGFWNRSGFVSRMREAVVDKNCPHQITQATFDGQGLVFHVKDPTTLNYLLNRLRVAKPGTFGGTSSHRVSLDWDDGISTESGWSPYKDGSKVNLRAQTQIDNPDEQQFELELTEDVPDELRRIVEAQLKAWRQ